MRSVTCWFGLVAVIAGIMFVSSTAVRAEEGEGEKGEQHEQLALPPPHMGPGHDMAPQPVRTVRVALTPGMENTFWRILRGLKCVGLVLLAVHIMLAVWVFLDIRKRGDGHGIFVALALLAGLPATLVYALVRLGDMKKG